MTMPSLDRGARRRVLLTGARGFTGVPMRDALARAGYEVVGTVLEAPDTSNRLLDLTSRAECEALIDEIRPDYVLHLAAISFVQHGEAEDFYRVNVIGTTNLLDALVRTECLPRKVLIASSANVYGNVGGSPIRENQVPAPTNHYAASKLAMEHLAATYRKSLPVIVTRPFNYTGVGQSTSFLVPKIVSHFARGESSIELGNIDVERDFSDVRTVVDVYRRLIESSVDGAVLNVCSGVARSLRSIIETMQEIAGYVIDVRVNAAFVRSNDIRTLTGDPSALVAAIGPLSPVAFHETLTDMYDALRTA